MLISLFGRDSNNLNVLAVSGLVSWVSGFAEEVLFRGLIFQGIYASFGLIPAYVTSSALFGLAHYPIFVRPSTYSIIHTLAQLYCSYRVQMLFLRAC